LSFILNALKNAITWFLLTLLLLILLLTDLSLGSVNIPLTEIFKILTLQKSSEVWTDIVWDFRVTKALTCILAGSALSLGGLQMQTLFRNPLAGPDVLGLSSGASLAVSLIFMSNAAGFQMISISTPWAVAIAASLGCAGIFLIMIAVSRRLNDNVSLLIVGLMVGAGTASIVSVLQYLSSAEEMQVYILWTFGSIGGLNWIEIQVLGFVLITGIAIAVINTKSLKLHFAGRLLSLD
jgi:iron complex transport system permease protein